MGCPVSFLVRCDGIVTREAKALGVRNGMESWFHLSRGQGHVPGAFRVPRETPKPPLHIGIRQSGGFDFHQTLLMWTLFSSLDVGCSIQSRNETKTLTGNPRRHRLLLKKVWSSFMVPHKVHPIVRIVARTGACANACCSPMVKAGVDISLIGASAESHPDPTGRTF